LLGFITRSLFQIAWIKIRHVPDQERLWRAVNKPDQVYKKTGSPKPSFFRDKTGLSCNLARFSTLERSRVGYGDKAYPPESGLVEFTAALVRSAGSDVAHKPVRVPRRNYAHAQLPPGLSGPGEDLLAKQAHVRIAPRFKA